MRIQIWFTRTHKKLFIWLKLKLRKKKQKVIRKLSTRWIFSKFYYFQSFLMQNENIVLLNNRFSRTSNVNLIEPWLIHVFQEVKRTEVSVIIIIILQIVVLDVGMNVMNGMFLFCSVCSMLSSASNYICIVD